MKPLKHMRAPDKKISFQQAVRHTFLLACAGLAFGAGAKFLDIYTMNLGNIFSQMSVWAFLGTWIAIYSSTPKRAATNVFVFCINMLAAYYATAEMTASPYSLIFAYGWAVFSLLSPILASIVWYAKGKGWVSIAITAGVIAFILFIAAIMFDKIRISDLAIAAVTGFMLLKKKAGCIGERI